MIKRFRRQESTDSLRATSLPESPLSSPSDTTTAVMKKAVSEASVGESEKLNALRRMKRFMRQVPAS